MYGTLKRSFPNHHLLPPATYSGWATSIERYPLVVANRWRTPILVAEPGQGVHVPGEVFEMDASGLAELDRIEGVGLSAGFDRTTIDVDLDGESLAAWTDTKPRGRIDVVHDKPLAEYTIDPR